MVLMLAASPLLTVLSMLAMALVLRVGRMIGMRGSVLSMALMALLRGLSRGRRVGSAPDGSGRPE